MAAAKRNPAVRRLHDAIATKLECLAWQVRRGMHPNAVVEFSYPTIQKSDGMLSWQEHRGDLIITFRGFTLKPKTITSKKTTRQAKG